MKTSQNLNKIISKLPKTELKVEKVELNISDDAKKKMFKAIETIYRNGENLFDELENNGKRVKNQITSIEKSFGKAQNIYLDLDKTVTKAAGELGVALNDIPGYESFIKSYFFIDGKKSEIIDNLKKYL